MSEPKQKRLPYFGYLFMKTYMKPYRKMYIIMLITAMVTSLSDVIFPMFNRYAIDHFIGESTFDTIQPFILTFLALLTVQILCNFTSTYFSGKLETILNRDLRDAGFHHIQTLSLNYFNENNVGYIHARLMSDTAKIGDMFTWGITDVMWQVSYLVFAFINMFRLEKRLAFLLLALLPLAVVFIAKFEGKLVDYQREIRKTNSKITSDYNEGITGISSIKLLSIEDSMVDHFYQDTSYMRKMSVKRARTSAYLTSLVSFMTTFSLALVLYLGGKATMDTIIEIGTLSVFMNYVVGMLDPIYELTALFVELSGIQVNLERFKHLLEEEPMVKDRQDVIDVYGDTFSPKIENFEEMIGDVCFENVDFKYPQSNEWILENFNLDVKHGTCVAIVGETGAGKSTLVNLVCRFYEPNHGRILIDGKDIQDRSQAWIHSNIGYVLQTPHLFSGTIRENLQYGKRDATDQEIYEALKLVSADFVVDKLKDGLDTDVGEGGNFLSLGEKQLLSFARAIIFDPKILILDEATASIDSICEKAIQNAIQTILQNRTSFVIAHRLSTIVDADVILVVDHGKIVEQGCHQELMKKKGVYYHLYQKQFQKETEA